MRTSVLIYGNEFDALLSCPKLCSEHTRWFEAKNGDVKRVNGVLQVSVRAQELIRRDGGGDSEWLQSNLVFVKWGDRRYLIAEEQGVAFCNAVNLGDEPRKSEYGDFFLEEGQEAIAVSGAPDVPERWSRYLLVTPVRGEVTELLPDMKAKVNIGRKHGIQAGMELVSTDDRLLGRMEIISVGDGDSVIKKQFPDDAYRMIRVGDTLTTHQPPSRTTFQNNR